MHFHRPWFGFGQIVWEQAYLNPGLAKNLDYNAVVVGGSYVQNTKVSLVNEVLGVRSLKLTISGGTPGNLRRLLGLAFGSGKSIKTVVVASPLTKFIKGDPNDLWSALPEYLWDENSLNDVAYLLNREVIAYSLRGMIQQFGRPTPGWTELEWLDQAYSWWPNHRNRNGKQFVLDHYRPPEPGATLSADFYLPVAQAQFNANIRPMVEAQPQTTFHFLLPPFSRLFWRDALTQGKLDAQLEVKNWLVNQLLEYPNVQVHDFMDLDLTSDLNNYRDRTHFLPPVGDLMIRSLGTGEFRVLHLLGPRESASFKALVSAYDDPDIPNVPTHSEAKTPTAIDQDLF